MLESLIAFHVNGFSNFVYILTSNLSFVVISISVLGTIALYLKEEIDQSVNEEQAIL